jgi:hypothetical protein
LAVAASDEKVTEQIFAGSLAILAVLIAVVGLVGAAQDKVSGISYLAPLYERFQWSVAGLSILAGIVSLLSLQKMRGTAIWMSLIVWLARLLIVGTVAVTVGFVWIS